MQLYIYFIIIVTSLSAFIFINRSLRQSRSERRVRMKERRQELLGEILKKKQDAE